MTTLNEMIEIIKAENPTLRVGDDQAGYMDLSAADYEATILEWASNRLAKLAKLAEAESVETAKIDAINKLTALGIDPKAFGLQVEHLTEISTADEI
jgi:hypothetical protein